MAETCCTGGRRGERRAQDLSPRAAFRLRVLCLFFPVKSLFRLKGRIKGHLITADERLASTVFGATKAGRQAGRSKIEACWTTLRKAAINCKSKGKWIVRARGLERGAIEEAHDSIKEKYRKRVSNKKKMVQDDYDEGGKRMRPVSKLKGVVWVRRTGKLWVKEPTTSDKVLNTLSSSLVRVVCLSSTIIERSRWTKKEEQRKTERESKIRLY